MATSDYQVIPPDSQAGGGYQIIPPSKPHVKATSSGYQILPPVKNSMHRIVATPVATGAVGDTGATISQAPPPTVLHRAKQMLSESAIGHAIEQTMPRVADFLGMHPTETVNAPEYEAHKSQLIAPEVLVNPQAQGMAANEARGFMRAAGSMTSGQGLATIAAAAATAGLASPAVPVLDRLIALGFSSKSAIDLVKRAPALIDLYHKDPQRFEEELGAAGFDVMNAVLMATHAAERELPAPGIKPEFRRAEAAKAAEKSWQTAAAGTAMATAAKPSETPVQAPETPAAAPTPAEAPEVAPRPTEAQEGGSGEAKPKPESLIKRKTKELQAKNAEIAATEPTPEPVKEQVEAEQAKAHLDWAKRQLEYAKERGDEDEIKAAEKQVEEAKKTAPPTGEQVVAPPEGEIPPTVTEPPPPPPEVPAEPKTEAEKVAAKPKKVKGKKLEAQRQAILEEAYKPGNVVKGYVGYDKVLEFKRGDPSKSYPENHWQVQVIASDRAGNPLPGERPRWHMTPPDKAEFVAAAKRLEARAVAPPAEEPPRPTYSIPASQLAEGDTFVDESGEPRRVTAIDGDKIRTQDGTVKTYTGTVEIQGSLNSPRAKLAEGGKGKIVASWAYHPSRGTVVDTEQRTHADTLAEEWGKGAASGRAYDEAEKGIAVANRDTRTLEIEGPNYPTRDTIEALRDRMGVPESWPVEYRQGGRGGGQEPITFGMTLPGVPQAAEAFKGLFEEDVKPSLEKAGVSFKEGLRQIRELVAPRALAGRETLDTFMNMLGEREKHRFLLDQILDGSRKMFDKLPKEEGVAFIDRYKRGQAQPSSELQELADFVRETEADALRRVHEVQIRGLSEKARKLWDAMPEEMKQQVVKNLYKFKGDEDLVKTSPVLKELVSAMTNYKENHFEVMWKVKPQEIEEGELFPVPPEGGAKPETTVRRTSRRPFQGSRSFMKQATLADMTEGLERGGEPVTYNPIEMLQRTMANTERYITAQNLWLDAADQGARVFVRVGERPPDGYRQIEDRIGNVQFPAESGEGLVSPGKWYMRDDYARLLNNYLSEDKIRKYALGRGTLYTKNLMTMWRLGFSLFHAMTTSVSGVATQLGLGGRGIFRAMREGDLKVATQALKDLNPISALYAPISQAELGWQALHYAIDPESFLQTESGQKFIKAYPEAQQLIDDAFLGGLKFQLHEDEKVQSIAKLQQAWANADWANNPIGSAWRVAWHTPGSAMQMSFKPLFEMYVPWVKLGAFMREHTFNLADYANDLATGKMTRAEIARKSVDGVEDLFGQVNWDKFFWDKTFKTTNQIAFRAAQWRAGNLRLVNNARAGQYMELARAARYAYSKFGGEVSGDIGESVIPRLDPAFAKIMGLFTAWTVGNALLQFGATKHWPHSAADYFAAQVGGVDSHGKPIRVTTPAVIMKDALSLRYHGLWNYLTAGESDLLGGIGDIIRNRDFANNMVHNPADEWWEKRYQDLQHFIGGPIAVETFVNLSRAGESKKVAALGVGGFTPPPSGFGWTPAERLARDILQEKRGAMTPEEQQDLQDYMRRKAKGQLSAKERKSAKREATEPILMYLVNARDKSGAFRMSIDDVLSVYRHASMEEQRELRPIIRARHKEISKIPAERRMKVMNEYLGAIHPEVAVQ
jgi:hypothetical protein